MKIIGRHRDYFLHQSEKDGHIEAWRTKKRERIDTKRPDGTDSYEHVSRAADPDVDRIVTTATDVVEAIAQIDRKLSKPRKRRKKNDDQQTIPFA